MWAETSRKSADVKEEWSVKRRKQCRKKKGRVDGMVVLDG